MRSLCARLLALPELVGVESVALYAAIGGEVPTQHLDATLRARGVRVAYPKLERDRLVLIELLDPAALRAGARGVPEPSADGVCLRPPEVAAFVVPGLLFDGAGRRLGRGGGHYDRLLAEARPDAVAIGVCYQERLVPELPEAPWDIRVHLVVTEEQVVRPEARRSDA